MGRIKDLINFKHSFQVSSIGIYTWCVQIETKRRVFHIQIETHPKNLRNEEYTIGYVQVEPCRWLSVGYSNYHNTVKYILRVLLKYVNGEKLVVYDNDQIDAVPLPEELTDPDLAHLINELERWSFEDDAKAQESIKILKNEFKKRGL